MDSQIQEAIKVLNQGGIIIYPTDTAFGIGCRLDFQDSIKKLFNIRKRPESQAAPVLVDSEGMAGNYWIKLPEDVQKKLISQYWPGALTIILPCKTDIVPPLVRGGQKNLGLRMPKHEIALSIINGIAVPLLGPSANFHGEKTPYSYEDLDSDLIKRVDYVVSGECYIKKASTVIDCSVKPWNIVRSGAINLTYH